MSMPSVEVRDRLYQRRDELTRRLGGVQEDLSRANGVEPNWMDRATQRENDEVLKDLEMRTALELSQVLRALERAEAGRYGECEICGKPIEPARLAAVPDATACAACLDGARQSAA